MTTMPAALRTLSSWSLLLLLGACAPGDTPAPEDMPAPEDTPVDQTVEETAPESATEESGEDAERDRNPFRKVPMPSPTPKGVKVTFLQSTQSYGTLMDGDRRVVRFWFRSEGTDPLVMSRIKPSCGCASVGLVARRRKLDVPLELGAEWKTGAVGFVELTIDSTSISGERKVFLRITNNAQEEQIVLQAAGRVTSAFEIRPPWSEWSDDGSGSLVATTSVEGLLEEAVESLAQVAPPPGLTVTSTRGTEEHGRRWDLEARWDLSESPPNNPMQILLEAQVRGEERTRVFTWTVRLPE